VSDSIVDMSRAVLYSSAISELSQEPLGAETTEPDIPIEMILSLE
jgi:hypothetical protein